MASDMDMLRVYYDKLRGTENAKNELIEDLLKRLDALNRDHEKIILDHARETGYNREVQKRELSLKEELRLFRAMIVSLHGVARQASTKTLVLYRSVISLSLS